MRTSRRLRVAVVVALAAGSVSAGYRLSRRARPGGGPGESRPGVAATDEPERDGWAMGARYVYRVEYLANAETSFRSGDQPGQKNAQVISFAGLLTATTIDVHNQLRDLEMTFALDRFAVTGTPPETTDAIRRALAQPFVVSYDATGVAAGIHAPQRPDNGALNVMRDLASLLQASNGTGPRWNSLEPELTGEVDVRYDRLAPDRLKKQKLEFRRVSQPAGVVAAARSPTVPRFVESEAYYHVDRGGRTIDLVANHVVNVSFAMEGLSDGQFRSGVRASVTRTSASFDPRAGRPGATLKLAHFGIMTDAEVLAGRQAARDRALVGNSGTAEILSAIAGAARGQEMGAAHPFMEKLSARVRLHPETLAEISRGDLGEQVLSAVGQAGTPAAQAKLAEVARDIGQPTDIRRFALDAFQDVARPTDDSFELLEEVAQQEKGSLKSSAVLSYGTLTLRQDENEPGTAGDKVRELASWFDAATTDEERAEIDRGARQHAQRRCAADDRACHRLADRDGSDLRGAQLALDSVRRVGRLARRAHHRRRR